MFGSELTMGPLLPAEVSSPSSVLHCTRCTAGIRARVKGASVRCVQSTAYRQGVHATQSQRVYLRCHVPDTSRFGPLCWAVLAAAGIFPQFERSNTYSRFMAWAPLP